MWVHIILFVLTFGIVLVWKAGWIRLDGIADRQSMRLFLLVAVCGNLLGMALTMTDGKVVVYQEGHRMEKTPDGAYTEELLVSVNGQKPQKFDVEIPEKETEETEVEPEQEVNETEQRQKELREIIEEYNQQKQDPDYYYLPDQWDGQKLIWQKSGDQTGSLLASLAFFAAFVVMLKKAKEQQEEMAKRAEQLLMDYPSLIMKFTLLIQAGMTARKVFQKMSADYMRNRSKTGRYAYEAITIMCHEMDSGVAEMEAYRRFGERCGQMKYKTFSTILIQNLQKGSHRMADLLEKEALESSIYLMVDTLKYLKKGGRITPSAALLGSALNLKPILQIQGDKLDAYKKVRGVKAAKKNMLEAMKKDVEDRFSDYVTKGQLKLHVAYTTDEETARQWKEEVQSVFPDIAISRIDPLSFSVTCHTGPGVLAIAASHALDSVE